MDELLKDTVSQIRGIITASENRIKERLTLLTCVHIGATWLMLKHFLGT